MSDRKDWKRAGMFLEYYDCAWEPKRGDDDAYDEIVSYANTVTERVKEGRGLAIVGAPGTGKTLMAHLVLDAALEVGLRPFAITMVGYQELLKNQMTYQTLISKLGDERAAERWWSIKLYLDKLRTTSPLVLIDDIGKEHRTASGYAEYQFDRIVRARGNRGLATLVTTNVAIDDWEDTYGASMSSYLHQVCDVVSVTDFDQRRPKDGEHRSGRRHQ